ncbi:hypothetical protein Tco_0389841 [Tanacetum coccineum]
MEVEDVMKTGSPAGIALTKNVVEGKLSFCAILESHIKYSKIKDVFNFIFRSWDWIINGENNNKGCRIMVIMGDYNVTLKLEEHINGSSNLSQNMMKLKECVNKAEVDDIHSTATKKDFLPIVETEWKKDIEGFSIFKVVKKLKNLMSPLDLLCWQNGSLFERIVMLRDKLKQIQCLMDKDPHNEKLRQEGMDKSKKNHKKTVKIEQARTQESEEYKSQKQNQESQASVKSKFLEAGILMEEIPRTLPLALYLIARELVYLAFIGPLTEEPVVNAATTTSTISVSTVKDLSDVDMTLAQALAELKSTKPKAVITATTTTTTAIIRPMAKGFVIQEQEQASTRITSLKEKGKGIMVEEPLKMKKKDQDKVETDYELAQRLQAEEQEELIIEEKFKLFQQLLEKRRKYFAAKRAEERRNRPPTKAQQRSIMVNTLVDMNTELMGGSEVREEGSETREESSSKRAGVIGLEEEKARRHGNVYNWETATYGKIWDNEDVHDFGSVETEFPAIVFKDTLTSEAALSCEPTVSSLNNDEIDFRISFDESNDEDCTVIFDKNSFSYKIIPVNNLKMDSENDNDKVNMPLLSSLKPTISYFDGLDFFKYFVNEFQAIVYNDAQTSKSDLLTEPILNPQHIDEFNLKDETSLSECDEEEQNVLKFNDLFPFNVSIRRILGYGYGVSTSCTVLGPRERNIDEYWWRIYKFGDLEVLES